MATITKQELQEFIKNVFDNKYEIRTDFNNMDVNMYIELYCKDHNDIFKQKIQFLLAGRGCPICKHDKRTEAFIYKSKQKFGNQFDYSKTVYKDKRTKLTLICKKHNKEFEVLPLGHLKANGGGCPDCFKEQISDTKEEFIRKAKEIHGDEYDYSEVEYVNNRTPVKIYHKKCGRYFMQKPNLHLMGHGCPICYGPKKLNTEEFIRRAKKIHGDKYDYSKVDYKNYATKVCIICPKHGEFWQEPSTHLRNMGCPKCGNNIRTTEQFIKDAKKVHGDKYDYSKTEYTNMEDFITIICPIHGEFKQRARAHLLNKQGCPRCSESHGEKTVARILDKYGIKYIREYKVGGYNYRYDFYLPDFNIYIEYHGIQHYKPVDIFGGKEVYIKTRDRDKNKKLIVEALKACFIVIPYSYDTEEKIEKYLISKLKKCYPYWYKNKDNETLVFKSPIQLYKFFNISRDVEVRDLNKYIEDKGFKKMF